MKIKQGVAPVRPSIVITLSITCAMLAAMLATSIAQESNVPYYAYATGSASVSSGPGFQYYATDRLAEGTQVEVHRQENEWVGIRPPEGSFSWVPASAVKPTDNPDVVQVAKAGTRPRVGTRYSTKRDIESVTMKEGELLEVIGEAKFAEGTGALVTWYKIAPPPGEFRWMRAVSLANAPAVAKTDSDDVAVAEPKKENSKIAAASYEVAVDDAPNDTAVDLDSTAPESETKTSLVKTAGITTVMPMDESQSATTRIPAYVTNDTESKKSSVQQAQWSYDLGPRNSMGTFSTTTPTRPRTRQSQQLALPGSPFREVNSFRGVQRVANNAPLPNTAASPAARQPPTTPTPRPTTSATPPVANTPVPPCGPARSQLWLMQQELMDIDLRLAQTVTQPPAGWSLSMLRARAQAVIDSSQVATVRDEGQRILAKIAQFEDVQRRSRRVDSSGMNMVAAMPNGGVTPTASAAGSWLANVPPEYFDSGSMVAGSYGDPYNDLESYASGLDSSYGGYPSSDGYVPMPGETVIADRRADEPSASQLALGSPSGSPTGGSSTRTPTVASSENYDGRGWLMPVVTDRDNMPRYVLTDSKGNVKQFVTPQPGLNLKRYLRKEIAIYGQERYMENLQRPHLTAERIVTMDSKIR